MMINHLIYIRIHTLTDMNRFTITSSIVKSRPTLPGIDAGEMKKLAAPKSVKVKTGIKYE